MAPYGEGLPVGAFRNSRKLISRQRAEQNLRRVVPLNPPPQTWQLPFTFARAPASLRAEALDSPEGFSDTR
jgi:hypothetical protein